MNLFMRLSYSELDSKFIKPGDVFDVFADDFENINHMIVFDFAIQNLAIYNYFQNSDESEPDLFLNHFYSLSKEFMDKGKLDYSNEKTGFTIITQQNLYILLKYIFSLPYQLQPTNELSSDLKFFQENIAKILLKINCYFDNNLANQKSKVLHKESDVKLLLADYFRDNLFYKNSYFAETELLRNYELIKSMLDSEEGNIANDLFLEKYKISIIDYMKIGLIIYFTLLDKYRRCDFKNIIDLKKDFLDKYKDIPNLFFDKFKLFFETQLNDLQYKISDNESIYDFYFLWDRPFLKIEDQKYTILDIGIFTDKIFKNTFIFFESEFLQNIDLKKKKANLNLRSNILGDTFENYVVNFLTNNLKIKSVDHLNKNQNEEITDCILYDDKTLLFIEIKAGLLPVKKLYSNTDFDNIINEISDKFGLLYDYNELYTKSSGKKAKGIVQLFKIYKKILTEEYKTEFNTDLNYIMNSKKNIISAVIVQDSSLSCMLLNRYVYLVNKMQLEKFNKSENKSFRFYTPIFISVNDLYRFNTNSEVFVNSVLEYSRSVMNKANIKSFDEYVLSKYNFLIENRYFNFDSFFGEIFSEFPNSLAKE